MKDKAPEGWPHRCSCRREKQVQSLQGCITIQEKILRHIHLTFRARGELFPSHAACTTSGLASTVDKFSMLCGTAVFLELILEPHSGQMRVGPMAHRQMQFISTRVLNCPELFQLNPVCVDPKHLGWTRTIRAGTLSHLTPISQCGLNALLLASA